MKKILVIEDNTEVRENICEILELSDYKVLSAPNGKMGVELAVSQQPDLVICDVMMPELDGFGVLRILNRKAETHSIPFIFLTARAEKADLRKGMGLGADDYLTKPFDDTELLDAIEMRLQKSQRLKEMSSGGETGIQQLFSEARAQEQLVKLSQDREERRYPGRQVIYEAGSRARWLYQVLKGKVKLSQSNEMGKELITRVCSSGEFFGYFALLGDGRHIDQAVALEDCEIRLIADQDFRTMLFNNRDLSAHFIKMLASRTSQSEQKLIEMAYSSVRRKVASALMHFYNNRDDKDGEDMRVSREDLASAAGTARETLIRTLSDFRSEGLIAVDGNMITILRKDRLQSMPQ